MSTTGLHPLAADYLRRLDRAARRLPRRDRLGEIVEAEQPDAVADDGRGIHEWAAILLLLLGGFLLFGIGPFCTAAYLAR